MLLYTSFLRGASQVPRIREQPQDTSPQPLDEHFVRPAIHRRLLLGAAEITTSRHPAAPRESRRGGDGAQPPILRQSPSQELSLSHTSTSSYCRSTRHGPWFRLGMESRLDMAAVENQDHARNWCACTVSVRRTLETSAQTGSRARRLGRSFDASASRLW